MTTSAAPWSSLTRSGAILRVTAARLTPAGPMLLPLLALAGVLVMAPTYVHAQESVGPELQLRIGWWVPTGALPLREDPDFPPPHGEVAFSQTVVVGAMVVWPLSGRFSLQAGADVGAPRPVAKLEGEMCSRERSQTWMDDDCRYRGAPRNWLVQGRLQVLAETQGPLSFGVGLAPRYTHFRGSDCQLIWRACGAANQIQRQPDFTVGLQGTALVRPTVAGRTVEVQLSNTAIRVEDRFQHEILLGLGIPIGW